MALDSAIQNVGEYYSAHYLAEQFPKDIAEQVKAWKEKGSQSIPRRLGSLADNYFRAKAQALELPDPQRRVKGAGEALAGWHGQLLTALGYTLEPSLLELDGENRSLPVQLRLHRHNQPWLAVCAAPFCLSDGDQAEEALELPVTTTVAAAGAAPLLETIWEKAIATLFKQEDRPRWVLLLAGSRVYLFDAHTHAQGRWLYVDLEDAFARKQARTFEAIAALLARETLAPDGESDAVLHERLREGSQKSAHGVSAKLQAAVRQAIALIANGWVEARRSQNLGYRQLGEREDPLPNGTREVTAEQLRHEALVTVYRILFCLYAEARGGELGILPITDTVYRLGYSIEALRDLADRGEPGTASENGGYYAEHLNRLFRLIHQGFHPEAETGRAAAAQAPWREGIPVQGDLFGGPTQLNLFLEGGTRMGAVRRGVSATGLTRTFVVQPLTATLFAPEATPLLNRVRLTNRVLHLVVRALSLGTGERGKQIGRINYAELGIVQLGAVYEGLLSYKGFFATHDLIQVLQKPKDAKAVFDDDLDSGLPTWFVPAPRLDVFKVGEVVLERRTGKPRIYKTGEFILHLNGVDRAASASYYTPLVLTQALVRETLKERLRDLTPDQADAILGLKVCEPAMGSAAFLVEAIGQLADRYLDLKQQQLARQIDPGDYEDQRRRVMHYIAVHNLYGVDLNPTAVELGALSLWLASIHRTKVRDGGTAGENGRDTYSTGATPWFGLRLRPGNSLIGARRAVWTEQQLINGDHYGAEAQAPRQLTPGECRKDGEVYHFLVWDEDMAPAARDPLMRSFWPDAARTVADWQRKQVKQPWTPEHLAAARRLGDRIDQLWADYARERAQALEQTCCPASVWPHPVPTHAGPSLAEQEAIKARLESDSGAFQRLKLLMDAWCGLYFWPLDLAEGLPSRAAWLAAAEVLLGVGVENTATRHLLELQLGHEIDLEGLFTAVQGRLPDAAALARAVPWYAVARSVRERQPFHHWELVFTEVLGPALDPNGEGQAEPPQGFDLMFGNPPWIKVSWNDAALLAEFEPLLGVREAKSATYTKERPRLLESIDRRLSYRNAFEDGEGVAVFLNDRTLYPSLAGVQTNLYKNFIERSWALLGAQGVAGLLHPEGVFDDPKGGVFRDEYYRRLLAHYQLKNERGLFTDVHHVMAFSVNIYRGGAGPVALRAMFNLFDPGTIEQSSRHENPHDPIPGIKTAEGGWETRGHCLRILTITEHKLALFARLFEDADTPALQARLPQVHSQPLLKVLEKFAAAPRRLADLKGQYLATEMFHESNAQRDGIITREADPTFQPRTADEWVVSGPHFYVGTPFNRTPRARSLGIKGSDYDDIDLTEIPDDYLPRSLYRPGNAKGDLSAFHSAIPEWPKPRRPESGRCGFWPVSDAEVPAWETLLGEPLRRYGIEQTKPGAQTARRFAWFADWQGDVEVAAYWLLANVEKRNSEACASTFPDVRLTQGTPSVADLLELPVPITSRYRYVNREMAASANERTLIPSLLPSGSSHIITAFSIVFSDRDLTLGFFAGNLSIVHDYLIKVAGRGHVRHDLLKQVPIYDHGAMQQAIRRSLRLVCLTSEFSGLWEEIFEADYRSDSWTIDDQKLRNREELCWSDLTPKWQRGCAIRSDFSRRQALLEIDVLVALSLGLTLDELVQIYSVQFPVMKAYEEADQYDTTGRRLPNTARKDPGAKELREALTRHDGKAPVTVSWSIDNGNRIVTRTFYPPFTPVDRIADYERAYAVFQERLDAGRN
jgi:hypothetical protein